MEADRVVALRISSAQTDYVNFQNINKHYQRKKMLLYLISRTLLHMPSRCQHNAVKGVSHRFPMQSYTSLVGATTIIQSITIAGQCTEAEVL